MNFHSGMVRHFRGDFIELVHQMERKKLFRERFPDLTQTLKHYQRLDSKAFYDISKRWYDELEPFSAELEEDDVGGLVESQRYNGLLLKSLHFMDSLLNRLHFRECYSMETTTISSRKALFDFVKTLYKHSACLHTESDDDEEEEEGSEEIKGPKKNGNMIQYLVEG
jgi:hypothetical protein